MAGNENFKERPPSDQKQPEQKKPDFTSFLKGVDVKGLKPANNVENKPLLLKSAINNPQNAVLNTHLLRATGVIISFFWLLGAAMYVQRTVGWSNVSAMRPHELGGFLAGILTPIALFWMIAAFILRSNDVKMYADALREEIQRLIFPSDEADKRVNNDIERLIRQTGEMTKATRIALKAIEEARAGLKDQTHLMYEGGENTIIGLDKLTAKLTTRMSETVFLGKQLEENIDRLDQKTKANSQVWEKITGELSQQTDLAEKKINIGTARLEGTVARIGTASGEVETKFATLSGNTETALNDFVQQLQSRVEHLDTLHLQTGEALKKASEEMHAQRQELRIEAEAIEDKTYRLADALQKSTGKLYEFTDDALDKAKLIETRLEGQSTSLQHILVQSNQNAQNIATLTTQAVDRLAQAGERAESETSRIETVLQSAIDRLEQKTIGALGQTQNTLVQATEALFGEVDKLGTRAEGITGNLLNDINRKIADTSSAFATIQEQIDNLTALFDARKEAMGNAGEATRQNALAIEATLKEALEKVGQTTQSLQQGIAQITEAVQQPITIMSTATQQVHDHAETIGRMMDKKAADFVLAAKKMEGDTSHLQYELQTKGQDVALIAGKIALHLKSVTEELGQQNTTLESNIGKSSQGLENLNTVRQ
ncbi:MAG: hypothetical protein JWM96_533, partial [Alphaproteobacteria bacterium]|nr:hypothetical protein [Alphaproteobacteria bacterium]